MKSRSKAKFTELLAYKAKTLPGRITIVFAVLIGSPIFNFGANDLAQASNVEIEDQVDRQPQITGFRSAQFGMLESQTFNAIQEDFQLQPAKISTQSNEEDRTSSLVATIEEIFPDSDPAQVVYIHGYKQKKLIQINIVWGSPVTDEVDPQKLVTTAKILGKYFNQLGFDPANTVRNHRVNDNIFIVFRATDQQGRMVLLQLFSRKVPIAETEDGDLLEPKFRIVSLMLSYIENVDNPDIFEIEKGAF